jgi:hypothetical protein
MASIGAGTGVGCTKKSGSLTVLGMLG